MTTKKEKQDAVDRKAQDRETARAEDETEARASNAERDPLAVGPVVYAFPAFRCGGCGAHLFPGNVSADGQFTTVCSFEACPHAGKTLVIHLERVKVTKP